MPLPPLPVVAPTSDLRLQQFLDYLHNFASGHRNDPRFRIPGTNVLKLELLGSDAAGRKTVTLLILLD